LHPWGVFDSETVVGESEHFRPACVW
jgi:hypothetical protein